MKIFKILNKDSTLQKNGNLLWEIYGIKGAFKKVIMMFFLNYASKILLDNVVKLKYHYRRYLCLKSLKSLFKGEMWWIWQ